MVTLGARIRHKESCHINIKQCETALSRGVDIYIINSLETIMSCLPNLLQGILITKEFKKVLTPSTYVHKNCRNFVWWGFFSFFSSFLHIICFVVTYSAVYLEAFVKRYHFSYDRDWGFYTLPRVTDFYKLFQSQFR